MTRSNRMVGVLSLLAGLILPGLPLHAGGTAKSVVTREYTHPLAFKWLRRGAYAPAARQFRQAHEANPKLGGPLAGWAFAECRGGDPDAAEAHAVTAAALDPDQPLLHAALACLAEANGDFSQAEDEYELATQLSILPLFGTYETAFFLRQGQYVDAQGNVAEMERTGSAGPSSDSIAVQCLLALGDVDTAGLLSEGIRTAGRSPKSGQSLVTLVALADQHLVGQPAAGYRYFIPSDGSVDRTVLLRAEVRRRLGDLDEAEELIGRRKREPNEPMGASVLVRVAVETGSYEDAAATLVEAQQAWPMHPSLLISEALLAAHRGDHTAAERALQLARSVGIPAWDTAVEDDVMWQLGRGDR